MQIKVLEITPALAEEWLQKNATNRKVRRAWVAELAEAMKMGLFQTTHQGVALNEDGWLIDGQHRLMAIIRSGVTVTMPVAFDVDAKDYKALMVDVGRGRSTADVYGQDKAITEPCTFIAGIHDNVKSKAFLGPYIDKFGPLAKEVLNDTKGRRSCVTASPVVAAAAVRMAMGEDPAYVSDVYHKMVALDYDHLPPVANSYLRQVANGVVNSHNQTDMFVRAMAVFSVAMKDNSKIQVKTAQTVLRKARQVINDFMSSKQQEIPA